METAKENVIKQENPSSGSISSENEPKAYAHLITFFINVRSLLWAFWLNYCLTVHRIAIFLGWVYSFAKFAYRNPKAAREITVMTLNMFWMNVKLAWLTHRHGFWTIGGAYNYFVVPTPMKTTAARNRARKDNTKTAKKML